MQRLLWITLSLVLGIIAASQLPAEQNRNNMRRSPNMQNFNGHANRGAKPFQATPHKLPASGLGKNPGMQNKPFKPVIANPHVANKPFGPITQHPTLPAQKLDPRVTTPKFPTKLDPRVTTPKFPTKLDPRVTTPKFPTKPQGHIVGSGKHNHAPKHPHGSHIGHHHKPCLPKCSPKNYPWPWFAHCFPDHHDHHHTTTVAEKPIYVQVPVYVERVAEVQVAQQLQQAPVGATLDLAIPGIGLEAGAVVLRVAGIGLAGTVNAWDGENVQVTLPMFGLEGAKEAEVVIVMADGAIAATVPILLVPAAPITE